MLATLPMKPFFTFLLALASSLVSAADSTALVIPKVTKPLVEPIEDDPLQADYDKMWSDYEEAIETASTKAIEAVARQSDKAADSGHLDFVEYWEGLKEQFNSEGKLDWDTSPKATVEWKKKYPKVPFPREFNEAVRSASNTAENARGKLEDGYASIVKAYTKAKNVPRAKELREEGSQLFAGAADPKASDVPRRNAGQADNQWVTLITDLESFKARWKTGNGGGNHLYDPQTNVISVDSPWELGTLKDSNPWTELYFDIAPKHLAFDSLDININGVVFKIGPTAKQFPNGTSVRVVFDKSNDQATAFVGQAIASQATILNDNWQDQLECSLKCNGGHNARISITNIKVRRPPPQ